MNTLPPLPVPAGYVQPLFVRDPDVRTGYFTAEQMEQYALAAIAAQAKPAPIGVQPEQSNLLTALTKVMSWIDNWSPSFTENPEWAEDDKAAREAMNLAVLAVQPTPLTFLQISGASRTAQIAFCLDKYPSFEEALSREIERLHGISAPVVPTPTQGAQS